MTRNEDLRMFLGHKEWYTHKVGIGYVPTKEAPEYIVKAIKRWNAVQKQREEQEDMIENQED